jgi:ADP-ribose pyrophosphatase YjhB (NUDIX family)
MPLAPILHCPACGHKVERRVPDDDNRERAVCTACLAVHYQNPNVIVGTVPALGSQVLMCRRAIEPRKGLWTLPAGFMELGESTQDGALRETIEEAGARIAMGPLLTLLNVVRVGQVHFFYQATLQDTRFDPGPETLEAKLFGEADMPWDEIAFRTVTTTLKHHFDGLRRGRFELHHGDIA